MARWVPWVVGSMLVLMLTVPARAEEAELDGEALRARLARLLDETSTMAWLQVGWETDGKKSERNVTECFWKKPDQLRVNQREGRGAPAVAVYRKGRVTGFKEGFLSFAKLSFDVRASAVLSLRGNDIRATGFLDDYRLILGQWSSVKLARDESAVKVSYRNAHNLPTTLWLNPETLVAIRLEAVDAGKVVEKATFEKVRFNPVLDDKLFDP